MAKRKPGFYETIEYIGPRPQKKPKRQNGFGGWAILGIAAVMGFWFGKPLMKAAPVVATPQQAEVMAELLHSSGVFGDQLAAAALRHSSEDVMHDPSYYMISYPGGDVPRNRGVAADVIVRCFRELGIDLQKEIHEDMQQDFRLYPQLWNATGTDTNIDHRRVPNLQRYFIRHADVLSSSRSPEDYQPGDLVVWAIANAETHIGIVVPGPADRADERWVVHHSGSGVVWENALFDYQILGHYRFSKID